MIMEMSRILPYLSDLRAVFSYYSQTSQTIKHATVENQFVDNRTMVTQYTFQTQAIFDLESHRLLLRRAHQSASNSREVIRTLP